MKTKALFISFFFCMFVFNALTSELYSQETTVKKDQPVIEIKNIPLQHALVLKAEVSSKDVGPKMGEMYSKLFSYAGQKHIQPSGAPFAVYYSYDPQGKTIFEAGFPVASKVNATDSIAYKEFPAMKVVSTLYTGSYENMVPVYTQLQNYLAANKMKPTGISWEVYLTDPAQVKNPSDNQTLIYFPVE
jgi:effector-binding domain-containing protein